jgi:hypothetical protein
MSHDLTTAEGRQARLNELVEQTRETGKLPLDTDSALLARYEAHRRDNEGFAELFRAESDVTRGNSVAYLALLDAIGSRTVAAQKWAERAEQLRARIAARTEGDAR